MNLYFEERMKTITSSLDSIDEKQFGSLLDECIETVKNGGKLVLSGLGKNVPICEKIVGTLNSLGIQANFLHTNTAMHGDLGMIRENDMVLVLSKSGSTSESVALCRLLRERKSNAWAVTFSKKSEISAILKKELTLDLENEGDEWNVVPNNSSSVYLILLQGLSLQLAEKLGITLGDFRKNHPGGAIGEKLRAL